MKLISCETQFVYKGISFARSYFWLQETDQVTVYQMKLNWYTPNITLMQVMALVHYSAFVLKIKLLLWSGDFNCINIYSADHQIILALSIQANIGFDVWDHNNQMHRCLSSV